MQAARTIDEIIIINTIYEIAPRCCRTHVRSLISLDRVLSWMFVKAIRSTGTPGTSMRAGKASPSSLL